MRALLRSGAPVGLRAALWACREAACLADSGSGQSVSVMQMTVISAYR